MAAILVVLAFVAYWIPTIVGFSGKHHNVTGILVVNMFLGWTLIGWVVALVWAVSKPAPPPGRYPYA